MNVNNHLAQFTTWYGPGLDGSSPTQDQWKSILHGPRDKPLTLVNFFKFREEAQYSEGPSEKSGQEAFAEYASVSMPAMQRAGGSFLHVGPFQGMFLGENEDWDLIAIGSYPDLDALIALYSDEAYRAAFPHRTAACERQKVIVCGE